MAKSVTGAVSSAIKDLSSLEKFKKGKNLSTSVMFKDQKWIPLSQAFQETLQIPGIPKEEAENIKQLLMGKIQKQL